MREGRSNMGDQMATLELRMQSRAGESIEARCTDKQATRFAALHKK